ncbi:hypothetical protein LMB81_07100 [Limosilactobacillus reuteri]|uniref:AAA family ATPase n=1 Tax=Limosilactobacillus reuteri TaxID=1598 RepID=UPI001E3C31CA|nr:hypothetical protein [Limosilactobacillus reuteri]MCC4491262.1 hypothetical protein [Limosilactobacillus reuteri]
MIENKEIIEWINNQHDWLVDATQTFYTQGKFTDEDIKRFADDCLAENTKNEKDKTTNIDNLKLLQRSNNEEFSLLGIENVQGVNALGSGEKLSFRKDGLTVIYGDNGAGKSGYMKIIKQVANTRYTDQILGNVYENNKVSPQCNLELEIDGKSKTLNCDLSKAGQYHEITGMDVFDTRISKAYVETAKEVSYEPWVLSLFEALANVAGDVKTELRKRESEYQLIKIDIPEEIKNTKQAKLLNTMSEKTIIDENLLVWSTESEKLLKNLQRESNTSVLNSQISQIENSVRQIEMLIKEINKYTDFYHTENIAKINNAKETWKASLQKKKAAQLVFTEKAEDIDKVSVSNKAWISLWQAASNYYNEVLIEKNEIKYTETGAVCPLCRQTISEQAAIRMESIENYVNGNISMEEKRNKNEYVQLLNKLKPCISEEQLENLLQSAELSQDKENILYLFKKIRDDKEQIDRENYDNLTIEQLHIEKIVKKLNYEKNKRDKQVLNKRALLNNDKNKEINEKIVDLKAQKFISSKKMIVLQNLENMKKVAEIKNAEKLTSSSGITRKSTNLANELFSKEYIDRFNVELKKLTRGKIRVRLCQERSSKGKTPFRLELFDITNQAISPSEVLSEGENRVVSLAAFFAEASGRNEKSPLIMDDPISSLDNTYEQAVTKRLVEASKKRQVIVFTHRISLVVGLEELLGKENIFEVAISGKGHQKGIPIGKINVKVKNRLNSLLNEDIPCVERIDVNDHEYNVRINNICQQFRIIVEKSVEELLLNGIVVRFRKDIQTKGRIDKLAKINDSDCLMINNMMTKYSYYDHSIADETPFQDFDIKEIKKDIEEFRDWTNEIRKRNK